jgi:hypothetical protein
VSSGDVLARLPDAVAAAAGPARDRIGR